MIALPTNKDENWRYANLRPLAKARVEAVGAGVTPRPPINLPAPLPGYERWVFVDGAFASDLSAPASHSSVTLLNARDAGEEFTAMLDASIATEGADFALARLNGARGDAVVHIAPASSSLSWPRPLPRRALPIRACRCTPGAAHSCASSNDTSAPALPTPPSTRPSTWRCAPTRRSITAGCST
jgi:hypothetical protein